MENTFWIGFYLALTVEVRWSGKYRGVATVWLRWATLAGEVLLTGHELAEQERERADRLVEKLRSLGIDLDVDI